jgi:hypothetical protein
MRVESMVTGSDVVASTAVSAWSGVRRRLSRALERARVVARGAVRVVDLAAGLARGPHEELVQRLAFDAVRRGDLAVQPHVAAVPASD